PVPPRKKIYLSSLAGFAPLREFFFLLRLAAYHRRMAECRVLAEQQRYDDTRAAAGWQRQLASTRPVCELDRHDDRVLRLLYLCDGGGARLSDAVLSLERSHLRDAAVVCDIRARVLRAAGRFGVVRALRRSYRTQGDAGRRAAHDGPVDRVDRVVADLRVDRRLGGGAAVAVSIGAGVGIGRGVGRRRVAGDRECPSG